MDFLKKFAESKITEAKEAPPAGAGDNPAPTSSESDLFSSVQVVAGAARATFQHEPTKVDNAELAGATADILDAAQRYGKLDSTTGIGGYVEKAETYLKQYEESSKPTKSPEETEPKATPPPSAEETEPKATPPPSAEETEPKATPPPSAEETEPKATPPPQAEETEPKATPPPPAAEEAEEKSSPTRVVEPKAEEDERPAAEGKSEGEVGDYVKMAEGFLNKESGDSAGSGYGDVLKVAGDFLKKN